MRQDIPLGRVAGIKVGANWTVAVILVLIAWLLAGSVLPGAAPHLSVAVYWTGPSGVRRRRCSWRRCSRTSFRTRWWHGTTA